MKFIVEPDFEGIRLDRFLKKQANLTHSVICKLIRKGNVLIDGLKIKNIDLSLKTAQIIIINNYIFNAIPPKLESFINNKVVQNIKDRIKYQDQNLAIIDKPAGLASQSGGSLKYSLDDIARVIWPDQAKIVHRLDKDTSGLIIIAKNRITATKIFLAFENREVEKEYLAVLSPIPKQTTGVITTNIAKAQTQGKLHKSENSDIEGKLSISEYEVIKIDEKKNIALVKFMPKTGRTHQIRLHASYIGCPVVGDFKYYGNCDLSKNLQLLAYKINIADITPNQQITADIPNFFLLNLTNL